MKWVGESLNAPLVILDSDCEYTSSAVEVAVLESYPTESVNFLLGSDIAGGCVYVALSINVSSKPQVNEETEHYL